MKNIQTIISILILQFSVHFCHAQGFPQAEITNGLVRSRMYLPDTDKGYYRAMRFDWSGVMPYLECNGHTYFGKWFKSYDPLVHESVMGPVEEFEPIGYASAKVGAAFLKIGVGTLIKKEEPKYNKFKPYEIENHGKWEVSTEPNKVEFKHILNAPEFAYMYKKNIFLPEGKPELVIHHEFTNNGNTNLKTQVYNHNFFLIDSLPIGTGYVVKFPFDIEAKGKVKGIGEFAKIEHNEIQFIKELKDKNQVYIGPITGYPKDVSTYDITIENKKTGAGVKIHCDQPLSYLAFWSATKTICPEPFITIDAAPGETVHWKITYTFYNF